MKFKSAVSVIFFLLLFLDADFSSAEDRVKFKHSTRQMAQTTSTGSPNILTTAVASPSAMPATSSIPTPSFSASPSATLTPAPSSSPKPKKNVLNQIIDDCRKDLGDYCAYTTCSAYASCVHAKCQQRNLECRTLGYTCPNSGHMLNLIKNPETGLWYVVDATSGKVHTSYIFGSPNNITMIDICNAIGKKDCGDCILDIYTTLQKPDSNPFYCAKMNYFKIADGPAAFARACSSCCNQYLKRGKFKNKKIAKAWLKECSNSCKNYEKMRDYF